jgi:RNA polymerase sigma-70 factor (ECF subfamily)
MRDADRAESFAQLVSPEVYVSAATYAARCVRTREEAEDLLHDALLVAYRRLHQLRHSSSFKPWLFAIIRNRSRSLFRRAALPLALSAWFAEAIPGPHETAEGELARALSALPASQQELLVLFYLDGLTLEETGSLLKVSAQAVGQRLFRARAALRRALESSRTAAEASRRTAC